MCRGWFTNRPHTRATNRAKRRQHEIQDIDLHYRDNLIRCTSSSSSAGRAGTATEQTTTSIQTRRLGYLRRSYELSSRSTARSQSPEQSRDSRGLGGYVHPRSFPYRLLQP